jgi:hypothetical protein
MRFGSVTAKGGVLSAQSCTALVWVSCCASDFAFFADRKRLFSHSCSM